MKTLRQNAPAKLNLSLRVLGVRDDGFHAIETTMVSLPGLADSLEFTDSDQLVFTCDDPSLSLGEDNLVIRAVRVFEAAAGVECLLRIDLHKRIPHGAGLGGGSSDAAAVLRGLNEWYGTSFTAEKLRSLAASIGSDVPFFITGGAACCRGRGELIDEIDAVPAFPVMLFKPCFSVATADAYSRWADSISLPGLELAPRLEFGVEWQNDLERPVFAKHRFLAEMKLWLLQREECRLAMLAGSGSTLIACLRNLDDAVSLGKAARDEMDPTLWSWTGMAAG
jgi:4-diphosphocytidyl-2-C-methyl-D-erythritol kinase